MHPGPRVPIVHPPSLSDSADDNKPPSFNVPTCFSVSFLKVRNSPLRWDRDGRPCSSPAALPGAQSSTEPSSPSSPARDHHQHRPSTAAPYGGRSCLKCDPRQWYRGEFMGELGGVGAGSPSPPRRGGRQEDEGEGGRLWNRTVSDR